MLEQIGAETNHLIIYFIYFFCQEQVQGLSLARSLSRKVKSRSSQAGRGDAGRWDGTMGLRGGVGSEECARHCYFFETSRA